MQIEEITTKILHKLHLDPKLLVSKNNGIICEDLIEVLLTTASIKEASELLDITDSALEHILRRSFKVICNKTDKSKWNTFLLSLAELKQCRVCEEIKSFEFYSANKAIHSNKNSICKECDCAKHKEYRIGKEQICRDRSATHYKNNKADYLARNAHRKALKIKATPIWADRDKIKEIYRSCPKGFHVDHIIPLKGELVCGLHVEYNLRHLPALENMQKYNKFTGEWGVECPATALKAD